MKEEKTLWILIFVMGVLNYLFVDKMLGFGFMLISICALVWLG